MVREATSAAWLFRSGNSIRHSTVKVKQVFQGGGPDPRNLRGRPRSSSEAGGIRALERALDILDALAANGQTLTALSSSLGQAPSTVHRVLTTLESRAMVEQDPATQAWHVGAGAFRYGSAFLRRASLVERAQPLLRRLMEQTGETANLGMRQGDSVLFISQAEAQHSIRAFFPPGTRTPLHASGIGKALLAHAHPGELTRLFGDGPLPRFTARTICDEAALRAELSGIAAAGAALDDEEKAEGMRCVAAPVFDLHGAAVAGLSVSGPTQRMTDSALPAIRAAVMQAAAALSAALGGLSEGQGR